jgi:hypothetical protein
MKPTARILIFVVAVTMLITAVAVNWVNIDEAYGSGPPYYARTTNMDKWTDPLPVLVVVDALTALLLLALIYLLRRGNRTEPTPPKTTAST